MTCVPRQSNGPDRPGHTTYKKTVSRALSRPLTAREGERATYVDGRQRIGDGEILNGLGYARVWCCRPATARNARRDSDMDGEIILFGKGLMPSFPPHVINAYLRRQKFQMSFRVYINVKYRCIDQNI
jgi:hypothetical protein